MFFFLMFRRNLMGFIKKVYKYSDLEERPLDEAPSLDMPHFIVDKFMLPKDGGKYMLFLTHLDKSYRPKEGCPYCHSEDLKLEGRAAKPRLVHDVIRNNYRVDIAISPPRMTCRKCGAKFTASIDGVSGSRQMTTRLEEFLRTECFLQPFTDLAERSGFSVPTIASIMDEEIEKYDRMRINNPLDAPRALGIDEKHISRTMRGTIVDLDKKVLLDLFEDNKKPTMIEGIKRLKDWDKNIKVVATDMNNAYIPMLQELLPDATIVIDKFHVIQDIEQSVTATKKACVRYRKSLIEEIEDLEERARQSAVLRIVQSTPRLFNFSMDRLLREEDSDRLEKLATVIDEFPEFEMLHNIHYAMQHFYKQNTREEAEKVWDDWCVLLPPHGEKDYLSWCDSYMFPPRLFDSFRGFSHRNFQNFKPFILNYFNSPETRITNAATEGLNNLIEEILQDGNGYEFDHLRAKCLYASLIHERISYDVDVSSIEKWVIRKKPTFDFTDPRSSSSVYIEEKVLQRITKYDFEQKTDPCSYSLPSITQDNAWLRESLYKEPDPEEEKAILEYRKMFKGFAGFQTNTPYDRPEGNETSIISGASLFYNYDETDEEEIWW